MSFISDWWDSGGLIPQFLGGGDENPAADAQANIANALWTQTAPTRTNLLDMLNSFTAGNYNFAEYPGFQSQFGLLNDQYNNARENILSQTGGAYGGGQLDALLAQNENARAGSIANLGGTIGQDLLSKAYGAAFNTPQTSIQGLGPSAYIQESQNQANDQMLGDIGSSLAWLLLA